MDKGLFLLFELVRVDEMQTMNEFHNNRERSAVKQKFINNQIEAPTPKDYQLWNEFKRQLQTEEIVTTFNFIQYIEWLQLISDD